MWKCEKCWTFRWVSFQSFRVRLRLDDSDDIGRAHDDNDNDDIWRMNIFVPQWGKLLRYYRRQCKLIHIVNFFFFKFRLFHKKIKCSDIRAVSEIWFVKGLEKMLYLYDQLIDRPAMQACWVLIRPGGQYINAIANV